MELIERDHEFAVLLDAVDRGGHIGSVSGPAGVGKTALVRAVGRRTHHPLWLGSCDALATPRPLGPLHDIALVDPVVADVVGGQRSGYELFSAVLDRLGSTKRVMIVEDVHWADEATLDLLLYLGRRIADSASTLILTYRPDPPDMTPELRRLLGDLATAPGRVDLSLEPLSPRGVEQLAAGHALDPARVHSITGGNPFFVTEVLASGGWTVPSTVADAVLARADRLGPAERELLDSLSVEPASIPLTTIERMGHDTDIVESLIGAGMLVEDGESISFRHELSRIALESQLSSSTRRAAHERFLAGLDEDEPARVAFHALRSRDATATLEWSIRAADVARRSGANHQTADHLRHAVTAADELGTVEAERMDALLGDLFVALAATDRPTEELEVAHRLVGDAPDRESRLLGLARLAGAEWRAGDGQASRDTIATALTELGSDETPAAARVHMQAGFIAMLSRHAVDAIEHGSRAVDLAERFDMPDVLVPALNAYGSTRFALLGDDAGLDDLERAIDLADHHGLDGAKAGALINVGSGAGEIRRYEVAEPALRRGIAFAGERDIDSSAHYARAWLGRVLFETGRWGEAATCCESFERPERDMSPVSLIVADTVLARLRTRRGEGDAEGPLETGWRLAKASAALQRTWPAVAARAEHTWLTGSDDATLSADLLAGSAEALELDLPWAIGELAFWAHRFDLIDGVPERSAEPFRLHLEGRFAYAAEAWEAIGCPYEQAWASIESGDEHLIRAGLEILTDLGARPLAERARKALRAIGVTDVPLGPRRSHDVPGGLTPRQFEVLQLLVEGLSDRQIGERLFISTKTTGHHVSAVLRTLEVSSRTEAAVAAVARGWVADTG